MRFFHATYLYPIKITWMKAIENGNCATFPRFNADPVYQNLPYEMPTIQGYHHQRRQGITSTTVIDLEPAVHETCYKVIE